MTENNKGKRRSKKKKMGGKKCLRASPFGKILTYVIKYQ